jgi:hypothetical protein
MTATKSVKATFTTAPKYSLKVTKTNYKYGTVTSTPSGINCGTTCTSQTANFSSGTQVVLSPKPITGRTFSGWSGACTGTGTCSVTMTGSKSVGATFR